MELRRRCYLRGSFSFGRNADKGMRCDPCLTPCHGRMCGIIMGCLGMWDEGNMSNNDIVSY